jgi:hypothetical protein
MSDHIDDELLLAFADDETNVLESVGEHVKQCTRCMGRVRDVRALAAYVANAGVFSRNEPTSEPLDDQYSDLIRKTLAPQRNRWRRWAAIAAATAAGALLYVGLNMPPSGSGENRDVALSIGYRVSDTSTEVMRGPEDRTLHFEIQVARPSYLVVLRMGEGTVEQLYPHTNPFLGTFGLEGPLKPDTVHRIPPSPIADYPAPKGKSISEYYAVVLHDEPTTSQLAQLLTDLSRLVASDKVAALAHLEATLGKALIVQRLKSLQQK